MQGERLIILATIYFFLMNILVKLLQNIPAVEIVFFRGIISFVLCIIFLYKKKISFWGKNRPILVLRGVVGTLALLIFFTTVQILPLGLAITLQQLSTIFTVLLAHIVLKEKSHSYAWFFLICAFVGMAILHRPGHNLVFSNYSLLAVLGAFLAGVAYTSIRYLGRNENSLVIILYFPLMMLPICFPFTLWFWVTPNWIELIALVGVGVLTQMAQYCMTRAYQIAPSGQIVIYRYLSIPLSFIVGHLLWQESYVTIDIVAILIILFSCLGQAYYSSRTKLQK